MMLQELYADMFESAFKYVPYISNFKSTKTVHCRYMCHVRIYLNEDKYNGLISEFRVVHHGYNIYRFKWRFSRNMFGRIVMSCPTIGMSLEEQELTIIKNLLYYIKSSNTQSIGARYGLK